jgi:hypothetical protein
MSTSSGFISSHRGRPDGHPGKQVRGGNIVLNGVSLSMHTRCRIGVVRPNGIGKTTLLRILAGKLPPDRGRVSRTPRSLRVGYLRQEPDARPGETLAAYLEGSTGVAPQRSRWRPGPRPSTTPCEADAYVAPTGACAETSTRLERLTCPRKTLKYRPAPWMPIDV